MSLWDKLTGNDQRKRAEEERQRLEVARQMSLRRAQQSSNPRVAQQATQKLQNNSWQVKQTQQPSLRQHIENATGTVGLGLGRSAIGTAQGLSGMYDLMTPGKGTNRFSQSLDTRAKRFDQIQKDQNRSEIGYKSAQFLGDAGTFLAGGGLANAAVKGASKAPTVVKLANNKAVQTAFKPIAKTNSIVNKGINAVAQKGAAGRITAVAAKNAKMPGNLIESAVDTGIGVGQMASKGQQVRPQDVALQAAISTGFNVGLPGTAQGVKEVFRMPSRTNIPFSVVRPEHMNAQDIADLRTWRGAMGTGQTMGNPDMVYNGKRASAIAGVDYTDRGAVDDVLRARRQAEDAKMARQEKFNNAKQAVVDVYQKAKDIDKRLGQGGFVRNPLVNPDGTPRIGKGAPIEKTPLPFEKALPQATATSAATPQGMTRKLPQQSSPQSQLEQPLGGQTGKQTEIVTQKTVEPKVDNSSTSIIQPSASIPVTQKGGQKKIDIFKVQKTPTGVTKTNVKTNRSQNFMVNEAGELVPDSKGAYKVFTDENGALTEVRVGDEVYTAKDIGDLTNNRNYGSTMATQRRNIERAFNDNPKTGERINELVVDYQQEQATKMITRHAQFKQGLKDLSKDLGISFGVGRHKAKKVSAAIQDFGEGKRDYNSLVTEYGKDYADKIVAADKWFRGQYDTLLDEANATLTKYGYDPIPKRDNYYTHFQDDTLFRKFGLKMQEINDSIGGPMQEANPTGVRGGISNELAGQSEYMTPNRQFNPFAQKRKGDQRTADAFGAFERYLNPTLSNIYMTPAITRARVMAKAIAMENDRVGKDANHIVVQMREWANHLAGKSNRLGDRQAADTAGFRQALQASNWVQKKVGANSIVGNFATAILQPIVLAQTAGKAGYKNTVLATLQEMSTAHAKNAPIRQSKFLQRRYTNLSPVTRGKVQRSADVAGTPLRVIEETAGRITWQANYNKALEKGLKGQDAIKFADIEAEKTMAGRAIGEKPELYRSKAAGFATQFQLEVNNYIQQVAKEMTPAQAAKTFVAAYGLNLLIQEATGRSVGFNPIDAAADSIEELASDDTPEEKTIKIAQRWGGEIVGNTPVVSSVLDTFMSDDQVKKVFGTQTPVGRFGVGSPYSSFYDNTVGKVVDGKPLEAAAYVAAPFGYSQAQKTVKGVSAWKNGELTDKDGNTTVEVPQTPGNLIRGALFGPSAIKEVNQYYGNIGVKKEDQKPVQNQTNSKAAKMGAKTDLNGSKLTLDEAKAIQAKEYGGKFKGMTESEITELAKTDSEAESYLTSLEATKAAYGKTPQLPKELNESARKILERSSRLTSEGKDKWNKRETTEKAVTDNIKSWLPDKTRPPKITNETAKQWAEFERDRLDGKINDIEANTKKRTIISNAYKSELDDVTQSFYKLGDDAMRSELEKGTISREQMNKVIEIDNILTSMGIQKYSQVGKKLRAELGYGAVSGKSSSSSSRSSKSRSSKRGTMPNWTNISPSKGLVNTRVSSVKHAPVKKPVYKGKKVVRKIA